MKVAIHGFTGNQSMWRDFPCQTLPLLGHHTSAKASGHESFAGEAKRLTQLLPGPTQELIGYSLGARLCLAMALQTPSRFSKLTLIGVSPGLHTAEERDARRQADQRWIDLLCEQGISAFVDAWESLPLWSSQSAVDISRQASLRADRLAHDPKQLAFAIQALGAGATPPMWDALPTLLVPIHLIVGALDKKYLAIAHQMLSVLPHAKLSVVENAGHNPIWEYPDATIPLLASTF